MLSCIAALTPCLVIGRDNALPWHLPADLHHFKNITMGKPIVMGRKTWESIGHPLPGRRNIVLSRDPSFVPDGCEVFREQQEVLQLAGLHTPKSVIHNPQSEVMIIGGAAIYHLLLPYSQRLYLTWIDADIQGDAWFPALDWKQWREISREQHPADGKNLYSYCFAVLERV